MFMNTGINLTIRDQVYKILRSAIVTGEFQWGEQLKESQLAERLNVSRSPIREALRQL
ncbi:MAG TPA: GntR family transcriptional regulator, partial [Peptococcaceae bacterium]|nr:GntR family transcriptional regulator [Peptococcaceae bacterium]